MASAVSGYKRSFGSDGPPGCYEDFSHTDCLIAWGSNLPEQHPIIYYRLKDAQEKRPFPLIVVDPRVTMLAQNADIHLPLTPGTDVVLQNALMHVIFKEGLEDQRYIDANTVGIDELRAEVAKYDPTTASKICGINEETIRVVARLFAKAPAAMQIWTMGINQSTHGTDGVVGINNLALITGNIGKPGGTSLSITGQCNAMGTREWSSCSGLPNYRLLEYAKDREDVAKFWNCDPEFFPKKVGMKQTDIYQVMEAGKIKGLWLIATNPMTSLPQHRTCPQGDGATGILLRPGQLRGHELQRIYSRLSAGRHLGGKKWRDDQHRAPHQPRQSGGQMSRRGQTGSMDIQPGGGALQ